MTSTKSEAAAAVRIGAGLALREMIWAAVHAGFGYFQREAGYTRTGCHGTRVRGQETGQWHEADLAVAHWLQHTSRDGDMQLHVHSQIAHVARTATDGKWRAPDSLGYNSSTARSPRSSPSTWKRLSPRGSAWNGPPGDGYGFEITGISGQLMRVFSSRRESISADLRGRAARFEQQYGRAPSQRELAHLAQAWKTPRRATRSTARWISRRRTRAGRTSSRGPSACAWPRSRRRSGTARAAARARACAAREAWCLPGWSWPGRRRRPSRWPSRTNPRGPARM